MTEARMNAKVKWWESFLESVNSGNKNAMIHDARGYVAAAVAEARAPLVAALRAVQGSVAEQIDFLHKRGLKAPRVRWESDDTSQHPEAFDFEGDFETDARTVYPARMELIEAVAFAALADAEKG